MIKILVRKCFKIKKFFKKFQMLFVKTDVLITFFDLNVVIVGSTCDSSRLCRSLLWNSWVQEEHNNLHARRFSKLYLFCTRIGNIKSSRKKNFNLSFYTSYSLV